MKLQSKLTFKEIHKSYENYDSYSLGQNEVKVVKPNILAFAVIE